jgi:hypothetical protein
MVRDHLEEQDIDGTVILKEISNMCKRMLWAGFFWFKIGETGRLL